MQGDFDDLGLLLIAALALKVWNEYSLNVAPAMTRAGVKAYEWQREDPGHVKDLPGKGLTKAQIRALAVHMGFPDPDMAVAIALAESGGIPNAILRNSREYSVGLWQINTRAWPEWSPEELKDPRRNAEAAFAISRGGTDWSHWSTYKSGRYVRFM